VKPVRAEDAGPVLSLEDIHFSYGGQPVLEAVSLRLERGMFLGLIGPNGSGKTTLLKIALGLLRPQQGTVRWFGRPLVRPGQFGARIAYVPQLSQAYVRPFPITVRELVLAGRVPRRGLLRPLNRADRDAVDRALAAVGMEDRAEARLSDLSGGQQQRAFIARALAADAEVLLLDEPMAGIDAAAQERFYDLLARLQRETGRTVMMVSHDLAAITGRVTHLACLNRRLICQGPVTDVAGDPQALSRTFGDLRLIAHSHGEAS